MFTFFNSLFLASFPENKSEPCQIEENTKSINMNVSQISAKTSAYFQSIQEPMFQHNTAISHLGLVAEWKQIQKQY